jgi:hypothetical protein
MLQTVIDHLINNVLPSAADYDMAENLLSQTAKADTAAWGLPRGLRSAGPQSWQSL